MYMLRYLIKNFLLAVFAHRMTIVISIYYGEKKLGSGVWVVVVLYENFISFSLEKPDREKIIVSVLSSEKMKIIVNRILDSSSTHLIFD